jgi:hypothetical protein
MAKSSNTICLPMVCSLAPNAHFEFLAVRVARKRQAPVYSQGRSMEHPPLIEPLAHAVDEFESWWKAKQDAADEAERVAHPLYHYTDARGLDGILRNEELWLTSIAHLNDPSELIYGTKIATDELQRLAHGRHDAIRLMCAILQEVLTERVVHLFDFFVSSLSRNRDELGQWRGYGDDGRGFAIGIAPHLFHPKQTPASDVKGTPIVAQVLYAKDEALLRQRELVARVVEIADRAIRAGLIPNAEQGQLFMKNLSVQLAISVLFNCVTTKHPAYAQEQETRLILTKDIRHTPADIETRNRGDDVVRFIRLKMPLRAPGNLSGIVVGPAAPPEAENECRRLLGELGIDAEGLVSRSDIPYRCRR